MEQRTVVNWILDTVLSKIFYPIDAPQSDREGFEGIFERRQFFDKIINDRRKIKPVFDFGSSQTDIRHSKSDLGGPLSINGFLIQKIEISEIIRP